MQQPLLNRLSGLVPWLRPPPGATTCRIAPPGIGALQLTGIAAGDPFIFGQLQRGEVFEPHVLAALRTLITPGACVFDVGANIGWCTVCLSRLAGPRAQVTAVEPAPTNLRLLRRNVRQNGCTNVRVVAAAAGQRAGHTLLRLSSENAGDHRVGGVPGGADTVEVRLVTLDSLLPAASAAPLVVKIDTQGAESTVLRGAESLLSRGTVRMVIEFWPFGLLDCGSSAEELIGLIAPRFDRLWALFKEHRPWPVTPERLLEMARAGLSPELQMFTDIVALRSDDTEAVAAMERGEYWNFLGS